MNGYIKRSMWFAVTLLGWLVLALPVQAASFECAKAKTKVEHIICDNPEISRLDEVLAQSYMAALRDQLHANAIRQTQKQWMAERNACRDVACVRSAYIKRNMQMRTAFDTSKLSTEPASTETPDKPGYFRLDKSNDDGVCHSLGRIINADIKKYGETRFDKHDEFVKWRDVDEKKIERGTERRYAGKVEQADADINNDGVIDRVIRSKWAMSRVELDALHVRPQNESKNIDIDELLRDDTKNISFIEGKYWRERYHKKYGDPTLRYQKGYSGPGWDWYFDSGVSIELFLLHAATYIVARSYAALPRAVAADITLQEYEPQPNASAEIYVFQLDKQFRKYEEKDVCMFVKICPCEGCKDLQGDEIPRALPAKKWCNK